MKPTVWIVQEPMRKEWLPDAAGQPSWRWVSKGLDLASAGEYGNTIIIWGPDSTIHTRRLMEDEARKIARVYNEGQDYMVAIGSPSLIGILAWAIGIEGKRLRLLEWDRALKHYVPTLGDTAQDIIQKG